LFARHDTMSSPVRARTARRVAMLLASLAVVGVRAEALAACNTTPRAGCVTSATASALIKEAAVGRERLKLSFKGMLGETTRAQFGNPVDGATRYDVCFYDDRGALAGQLIVDRGGQSCGPVGKPCWAPIGPRGWRYKDVDAAEDGVQKILMQSGPAGRGRLLMKAGNAAGK